MQVAKRLTGYIGSLALILLIAGCDSTRNEQGVSYTALGWFEVDQDESTCAASAVNEDVQRSGVLQPIGDTPPLTGCPDIIAVGLQNNLCCQGIRSERLLMDFFIPGALVQPPSTAITIPGIIAPSQTGEDGDGGGDEEGAEDTDPEPDSSLPDDFGQGESVIYWILSNPVPASVAEWISLNRAQLPAAPFEMIVTARATGITTAGDRVTTNALDLGVTLYDELSFPVSE